MAVPNVSPPPLWGFNAIFELVMPWLRKQFGVNLPAQLSFAALVARRVADICYDRAGVVARQVRLRVKSSADLNDDMCHRLNPFIKRLGLSASF
jgi:hypothetical protein